MPLIRLVYVSSATVDLSDSELNQLLEQSVRNNAAKGVTGMLVYADGNFIQVLEGEAEVVDALFQRIELDIRHQGTIVLHREVVESRDFPQWHMGFRRLTRQEVASNPAYVRFFDLEFDPTHLGIRPGVALELLRLFNR